MTSGQKYVVGEPLNNSPWAVLKYLSQSWSDVEPDHRQVLIEALDIDQEWSPTDLNGFGYSGNSGVATA